MPSACLTSHKQEGQRGWLSQEANANRPLRLALAKGACSLATGSSCGELRLVPSPSLACFPETRYAFAKPNRLWQRQLKISSAFVSLELGPAEGTGNQPNPGLFFFFFSGCCRGPFAMFAPAAPCSPRDPRAPAMEHAQRGLHALPDPSGGSCCGVRVPLSSQGAARTASAAGRGPGS